MKKLISLLLTVSIILSCSVMLVNAAEEATDSNEIEFVFHKFHLNDPLFKYELIKNEKELQSILALDTEKYPNHELTSFAEGLGESFFDEKALIAIRYSDSSGCKFNIDSIVVENELLVVDFTVYKDGPLDVYDHLLVLEVNKSDVENVENIRAEYKKYYLPTENYQPEDIPFTQMVFSGSVTDECLEERAGYLDNPTSKYGMGFHPVVINNLDDLDNFKAMCKPENEFLEYASTLTEEYFQENTLAVIYGWSPSSDVYYNITAISALQNGNDRLILSYGYASDVVITEDAVQESMIVAEIKKIDGNDIANVYAYNHYSLAEPIGNDLPSVKAGDIDGNSNVGASDYLMLKKVVLGTVDYDNLSTIDNETTIAMRSDINGDGKITAVDYLLLKSAIFGKYQIAE